jgi:hypothetical protein
VTQFTSIGNFFVQDRSGRYYAATFLADASGAVGGLIAQKFVQVLATSMTADLSKVSIADVFAGQNLNVTAAGIGAVSSFLTAELGSALKIDGFGGQLFNTAANGFTVSVLRRHFH